MADYIVGFFMVGITMFIALWFWYAICYHNYYDDHYFLEEDYTDVRELALTVHRDIKSCA